MNKTVTRAAFTTCAFLLGLAAYSHAASLGKNPAAALVQGADGSLYGTTANGGTSDLGAVFKIDSNGFVTTTLSFTGTAGSNRGATPLAPLIFGTDGKLYGTTSEGGSNNRGTIFRVSSAGVLETLHDFVGGTDDGAHPKGKLIQAADGNFYGMTFDGGGNPGQGTIFRMSPNGTTNVLFKFDTIKGAYPDGGLVQGRDGFFYGVAFAGGGNGLGTIFRADPVGNVSLVYSFTGAADGSNPQGELVEDPATTKLFYGTTSNAGASGYGTVYKVNVTVLPSTPVGMASFDGVAHGANPHAAVVVGSTGLLYGTTFAGGANNLGTVFQVDRSTNVLTRLASFMGTDGAGPDAALLESATALGTLYGTTYSGGAATSGTVFKIVPPGALQTSVDFANPNPPSVPVITSATAATINPNTNFSYQITAVPNATSYNAIGLPSGLSVNTATGIISGSVSVAGNYTFTVSATNGAGTGTAGFQLIVLPSAPLVVSATNATGQIGVAFSYQIVATNAPTGFSATGLPSGLAVNSTTGVISGQPAVPGVFDVIISAANNAGTGTATLHLTILQSPPVITSVLAASVQRAPVPFSYQITANNNPTSYDAFVLPAGLNIDRTTGVISGAPLVEGTYDFTIAARNSSGTGSATFRLTVFPPAPVINSPLAVSGIVGAPFLYQVTTVEPIITPVDPLGGFSSAPYVAFGTPPGLFFDKNSGIMSGIPTTPGTYKVVFEAASTGGTAAVSATITIDPARITSPLATTGQVGKVFSYQITSSYSGSGTFTASNLPPGLTLNTSTGVISGIPTVEGIYSVPISATPSQQGLPPVSGILQITISSSGGGGNPPGTPAPPLITPGTGVFKKQVNISIRSTAPGTTVYFTINGTDPTTSSIAYHGQIITVKGPGKVTIKAISVLSGGPSSPVASATYTITKK